MLGMDITSMSSPSGARKMKAVTNNTNPQQRPQYRCNVCGMYYSWSDDHRAIERSVGKGYSGYEVDFITCSDKCRESAREVFITWLAGYDGWDRKSAADNWDKYIS